MGAGSGKGRPAKVTSVVPKGDAAVQKPESLALELPEDGDVDDSIAASDLLRDEYYDEYNDDGSASTASRRRPAPLNLSPRNQKNDTTRQGYLHTRKIARLQLEEAVAGGSLQALKAAMRRAQDLGLAGRELAIGHEALTRLEGEEKDKKNVKTAAKKALQDAIAAKDLEALQPALQHAMQIGLPKEDTKAALNALQSLSIEKKSMRDVMQMHRDALAAAMKRSRRKELDLVFRKAADAGLPAEDLEPARKLLLELDGKTEEEVVPLPAGWREHFDIVSGLPYYELITSGEVFWERPTADMAVPEPEVQAPPQLPGGWEMVWDEGYQAYYYCNCELGVSQWEPPSPAAMPYHKPNIWTDVHSTTPPPPFDLPCQPMEYHEPVAANEVFQPPIIGWSAPSASSQPKIGIATRFQQMRKERSSNMASKVEATPSPTAVIVAGDEALEFVCDNCGAPRLVTGAALAAGDGKATCTLCQWVGIPSQISRQRVVEKNKEITRKKPPPKPKADSKAR